MPSLNPPAPARWIVPTLAAGLGGLTLLRIWYAGLVPLAPDEATYWTWSRNLDWGYYDGPPLVAGLIRLGTLLIGNTERGVRLMSIMLGLGLSLLVFDFCRRFLKDALAGFWLVAAFNGSILFGLGSLLGTYDILQNFLWMLGLHLTALALLEDRRWAWPAAGLAVGLSIVAKYNSVMLLGGIGATILFTAAGRRRLATPWPWLALLAALLAILPNVWWNYQHDFVSVRHVGQLATGDSKPFFTTHQLIGGQLGLVGPVFLPLIVWGLALAWRSARRGDVLQSLLLWAALPTMLMFLAMSTWTRVYDNWPAPCYLSAGLAACAMLAERMRRVAWLRRAGLVGLLAGYLAVAGAFLHQPLLSLLDLKPEDDPTAELYGWPDLGRAVADTLAAWPGRGKPFVFAIRHQLAASLTFYTPGHPEIHELFPPHHRLSQYLLWTNPDRLKGRDGLAVLPRHARAVPDLAKMFREFKLLREVDVKDPAGRVVMRMSLHHGRDFLGRDARPASTLHLAR